MNEKHISAETTYGRPFSLLCVDDDPYISDALARCLVDYGIHVLRAYDGMQGYWRVLRDKPAAVISDLSMPNGNGIEMIEWLRSNATTEFLPVIVLTGTDDVELRRRLRKLKVSAILEKPASVSEILLELFLTDFISDSLRCEPLRELASASQQILVMQQGTEYAKGSSFADCSSSRLRNN